MTLDMRTHALAMVLLEDMRREAEHSRRVAESRRRPKEAAPKRKRGPRGR